MTERAVLVTGGGGGIGEAIARRFAADGWRVAVNGRRPEPIAAVAGDIGGVAIAGDISDAATAERVVAETVAALGGRLRLVTIPRRFWIALDRSAVVISLSSLPGPTSLTAPASRRSASAADFRSTPSRRSAHSCSP